MNWFTTVHFSSTNVLKFVKKRYRLSFLTAFFLGFISVLPVFAQPQQWPVDFMNIMESPQQFRFAWAQGNTREAALSNARKQLIESIFVRIDASVEVRKKENNEGFDEDFSSVVQTSSKMSLSGLRDLTHNEGDTFYVLAYITNGNLQKSLDNWKTSVLQWVSLGEQMEQRGLAALSLRSYYSAYLAASKLYPEPINYQFFDRADEATDIVPILYEKITMVLKNIEIEPEDPVYDGVMKEYVVKLNPKVFGKPVKNLEVGYESQDGSMWVPPGGDGVYVPIFNPPASKQSTVAAFFSPHERSYLEGHSELSAFAYLPPEEVLTVKKLIKVDFSSLITIDFDTKVEDLTAVFTPKFKHISPVSFTWDFGDGNDGLGPKVSNTYLKPGVYDIKLTLNESEDLVFTKKVFIGIEEPQAITESVPVDQVSDSSTTIANTELAPLTPNPVVPTPTPTVVTETVNEPISEPVIEPIEPEKPAIVLTDEDYKISSLISEKVTVGMKTNAAFKWLDSKKREGVLYIGRKNTDFVDAEGATVIIANPKTNVEDILVFRKGVFGQLSEKKQLEDLSSFKGKVAIWVVVKE